MPELPEAETIARTLAPALEGRSLVGVKVLNRGSWQSAARPEAVCPEPRPFLGTGRRGKLVLARFADAPDCTGPLPEGADRGRVSGLAFHLKMTGRLFPRPAGTRPGAHTRVVLDLDDGSRVFFDDCRKFGYVRALSAAELEAWAYWRRLGPEPLGLDPDEFAGRLQGRRRAVKSLLLDQGVVAGIGNIYADESLFRAGIAPWAERVGRERLVVLGAVLQDVLRESIRACGSSIRDYRTASGDVGSFQNAFRVYGRAGQPCMRCGAVLRKRTVAGRTTVFCPRCQRP